MVLVISSLKTLVIAQGDLRTDMLNPENCITFALVGSWLCSYISYRGSAAGKRGPEFKVLVVSVMLVDTSLLLFYVSSCLQFVLVS